VSEAASRRVDLIPAQRRALILERLRARGAASVQELASDVGTSASTIRRDLEQLTEQGYLRRTHGGALLQRTPNATFEPEAAIAAQLARPQKRAIGEAAAALLEPGQSVVFDSSSTVLEAARSAVARDIPLTAVTNDLATATVLSASPRIRVVVPGGTVRPGSATLLGEPGEGLLRTLHADVAFLGTHAITGRLLTETDLDVAAMKRAVIPASRRIVVLADSSKFQAPAFCTICDVAEVHEVVTDDGVDPAELAALRALGVSVTVVPAGAGVVAR
jgi:DeoR family transcriptional regulator of aga operon